MCASFKITFHCGKEVNFDDSFWKVFQVSPREDPEKAKQVSHYFPLRFTDFAIFLYRTKEIDERVINSDTYPVYSTLCELVKAELFQDFFLEYDAERLSEKSSKDQATLDYPNDLHKRNEARFKSYADWWYQNNHLYPFIHKSGLEVENDCDGGPCPCGKHKIKVNQKNNLVLELPQRIEFACWQYPLNGLPDSHSLSPTIRTTELKWSLFSDLYKCPYIYLKSCLVINLESRTSIVKGILSEEYKYGIYYFTHLNTYSGDYSVILKELINVAEAIHFIHKRNYTLAMLWENTVVIPKDDEGGISFKIYPFTSPGSFCEYKLVNGKVTGYEPTLYSNDSSNGLYYFKNESPDSELNYFQSDWDHYWEILSELTIDSTIRISSKPNFEIIKKLQDAFYNLNCCTEQQVFDLFKEYLTKEIEAWGV